MTTDLPARVAELAPTDDELRLVIYENFDSEEATFKRLRELFARAALPQAAPGQEG
jgi:hypothetical protein